MSIKHILFVSILSLASITVYAAPEGVQKVIEKENKGLLQKDLKVDIKPIKEKLSVPKDKINVQEKSERKEFGNQAPCLQTLNMMEKRINVLDENLKKRRTLLEKIKTNLDSKIQLLKSSGLDTTKVESAFNNYVNQTEDILKQREGSVMVLADLTRFDCGGDPVNFKKNLKDFNQRFKNQNLEFNRINQEFRVKVLYEIHNLIESSKVSISQPSSTTNE